MNTVLWICCFLPLIIILLQRQKHKKVMVIRQIIRKKHTDREKRKMEEMAKLFIGKDCLIYLMDSQVNGKITEVTNGAVVIDSEDKMQVINLDFVVRIRQYPTNKKGKRQSVVLD